MFKFTAEFAALKASIDASLTAFAEKAGYIGGETFDLSTEGGRTSAQHANANKRARAAGFRDSNHETVVLEARGKMVDPTVEPIVNIDYKYNVNTTPDLVVAGDSRTGNDWNGNNKNGNGQNPYDKSPKDVVTVSEDTDAVVLAEAKRKAILDNR